MSRANSIGIFIGNARTLQTNALRSNTFRLELKLGKHLWNCSKISRLLRNLVASVSPNLLRQKTRDISPEKPSADGKLQR